MKGLVGPGSAHRHAWWLLVLLMLGLHPAPLAAAGPVSPSDALRAVSYPDAPPLRSGGSLELSARFDPGLGTGAQRVSGGSGAAALLGARGHTPPSIVSAPLGPHAAAPVRPFCERLPYYATAPPSLR